MSLQFICDHCSEPIRAIIATGAGKLDSMSRDEAPKFVLNLERMNVSRGALNFVEIPTKGLRTLCQSCNELYNRFLKDF